MSSPAKREPQSGVPTREAGWGGLGRWPQAGLLELEAGAEQEGN